MATSSTSFVFFLKVISIDADGHELRLASGASIKYGKLLIATG